MLFVFDPHADRIAHTLFVHCLFRHEDELHRLEFLRVFQFADYIVHKLPVKLPRTSKTVIDVVLTLNIDVDFFRILFNV